MKWDLRPHRSSPLSIPRLRADFWTVFAFVAVSCAFAVHVDLFDQAVPFVSLGDGWKLDDILLVMLPSTALALAYHAVRRWRELSIEINRRRDVEAELSALNAELEERVASRTKELRTALRRLEKVTERYELVARGAQDGLWDWDVRGGEVHYSRTWKEMLGLTAELGVSDLDFWVERVHPADRSRLRRLLTEQAETGDPLVCEYRILHTDGAYRWMQTRAAAKKDDQGRVTRIAGAQRDITEHKAVDPLTGLGNRLLMSDRVAQMFDRVSDEPETRFAVMALDIDRFKEVNETLGYLAGDQLLLTVAARVTAVLGSRSLSPLHDGSLIARFGGDEFALVVPRVTTSGEAMSIAKRIVEAVGEPIEIEGRRIFPSVSIGVSVFPQTYESAADMVRDADTAMHVAKTGGRGKVEVFRQEMRTQRLDKLEIDADLRTALTEGQLRVVYQPKFALAQRRLVGFEALLRWDHPTRGVVPPLQFIPVAESCGLINEIGQWVLRQACLQSAAWNAEQRSGERLPISVNVSPQQLEGPDFARTVSECLRETGCPPDALHLEITESAILTDSEEVQSALAELRKLNLKLEIDDFGTGYSSLDHLRRFRFDILKIDSRFVRNLNVPSNREILTALVELSHRMGMKVTAEGIETEADLHHLVEIGCEIGQGYLFHRPLAPKEATELIGRQRSLAASFRERARVAASRSWTS